MPIALSRFPALSRDPAPRRQPLLLASIAAAHVLALWAVSRAMPPHEFEQEAAALIVQILSPQPEVRAQPTPSRSERPRPALPERPRPTPAPVERPTPSEVEPVATVATPRGGDSAEPAEPVTPPAMPAPIQPARSVPVERQISITQVEYLTPPVLLYPLASRRMREQGLVQVRVRVDERGLPERMLIVRSSGAQRLDDAALATVRATRFKPYAENGIAMTFWVVMPLVFELET